MAETAAPEAPRRKTYRLGGVWLMLVRHMDKHPTAFQDLVRYVALTAPSQRKRKSAGWVVRGNLEKMAAAGVVQELEGDVWMVTPKGHDQTPKFGDKGFDL
jgi:hypothetical protein